MINEPPNRTHDWIGGAEEVSSRSPTINNSLGVFAAEFGISRDVLRRILSEASVAPIGEQSGRPIYRLRDVYLALSAQSSPEQLSPHGYLARVKAIQVEDAIKKERGELVPAFEVELTFSQVFKKVVFAFDTATDNLERDVGLSADQATALEKHFDGVREELYCEVCEPANADSHTPQPDQHTSSKENIPECSKRQTGAKAAAALRNSTGHVE